MPHPRYALRYPTTVKTKCFLHQAPLGSRVEAIETGSGWRIVCRVGGLSGGPPVEFNGKL